MKLISACPGHRVVALVLCALFISGCSGSGDSSPSESQSVIDSEIVEQDNDATNDETVDNIDAVENEPVPNDTEDGLSNQTGSNQTGSNQTEPTSEVLDVVPDPTVQTRTQVNFEITVPAYQSNALQVRLTWGDIQASAGWVGDELWSLSLDFPSNTEQLLTIVFSDGNGDVELGSYEQTYKTGFNDAESLQVSADQFETAQFDDDGDGVSNLDELVAGNDPTIDGDSLLEVRDFIQVMNSGISVTANLESLLSEERPMLVTTQEKIGSSVTIDTDIQIDMDGNGTFTRNRIFSCEYDRIDAIRTHAGNAISWEASRIQHDCDFTLEADLTNTVTIADENTRTYVQELVGKRYGSFTNSWQASTNLTGRLVEGTSLCKPVAGTYSSSFISRGNGHTTNVTFASKEINDPYWRVETEVTLSNFYVDPVETTILKTEEYFVRDLHFGGRGTPENPELFVCDFVDI